MHSAIILVILPLVFHRFEQQLSRNRIRRLRGVHAVVTQRQIPATAVVFAEKLTVQIPATAVVFAEKLTVQIPATAVVFAEKLYQ